MTDELASDEEYPLASPPALEPEIAPEIALVLPAAAYDSIATDDEVVAPLEDSRPDRRANYPAEVLAALGTLNEALMRKLDGLQSLFEREIRAEATREKVVDRLHAELQEYKQDLLLNVLRPIFVDLIQLHDDIGKIVATHSEDEGETDRLLVLMAGFQQGIEDILYRQGVEPFQLEGDSFDPRRQRAVATVPTDDPTLNKTIASRHRKGFHLLAGEKMIRPEIVSVHSLRKVPPG